MSTALMTLLIICMLNKPIHIIGTPPDKSLEDERGMGHNDEEEKLCDQEVGTILNPHHNGQENNQRTATRSPLPPQINTPTFQSVTPTLLPTTPTLQSTTFNLQTNFFPISHLNPGTPELTCLQTNNNSPFNQVGNESNYTINTIPMYDKNDTNGFLNLQNQRGNQSNSSYNQNQIPQQQYYLAQASSSTNNYNQIPQQQNYSAQTSFSTNSYNQIPQQQNYLLQPSHNLFPGPGSSETNSLQNNNYNPQEFIPQENQGQYFTPDTGSQDREQDISSSTNNSSNFWEKNRNKYKNFIKNKDNYLNKININSIIFSYSSRLTDTATAIVNFIVKQNLITSHYVKNWNKFRDKAIFERFIYNTLINLFINPYSIIYQLLPYSGYKNKANTMVSIRRLLNKIVDGEIKDHYPRKPTDEDVLIMKNVIEKLVEKANTQLRTLVKLKPHSYTEINNQKHRRQDDDDNGGGSNCFQFLTCTIYPQQYSY